MNLFNSERNRWKKRTPRFPFLLLLLFSIFFFFVLFYTKTPKSLQPQKQELEMKSPQCSRNRDAQNLIPKGERFLWYAPHSGFSNQLSELKNAIVIASILNRTLVIPPILDHHSVALGSCPKFRVSTPTELRVSVWDHIIQLVQTRRIWETTQNQKQQESS